METDVNQPVGLGTWLGRGQAFGVVANHCSAAQAECLRSIRDSEAYKSLGVTWEDFCRDYVGLSRWSVEALIEKLEEFGETYFRLAQIVRISPDAYRQIAPKIENETVEIGGEIIPLTPENAVRIRNAVRRMCLDRRQDEQEIDAPVCRRTVLIQARLDACFWTMQCMAARLLNGTRTDILSLHGVIEHSHARLGEIANLLPDYR